MGHQFLVFCDDNHIRVDWAAVAHPRMNGQVERANDMVLAVQPIEELRWLMGRRTPSSSVEPTDDPKQGHRLQTILHGVRL